MPEPRTVLVVCTANVCRSPSAARLLQRRLDELSATGERWMVTSAGTSSVRARMDDNTIAAARVLGIDLGDHRARHLDADILRRDGADVVLTMARAHTRDVIGIDPGAWPRTFTLKELARRAGSMPPAAAGESMASWLARAAEGRRAADMVKPDPIDDIDDPYGARRRAHDRMIAEVDELLERLVRLGPWSRSDQPGDGSATI